MATGTCTKSGCSVSVTGKCVDQLALTSCPNFAPEGKTDDRTESEADSSKTIVQESTGQESEEMRRFHSAREFGLAELTSQLRGRYGHLVALLGKSESGKTCFLVSLYLMALHRKLQPSYSFAGSKTLHGFEVRARYLRGWGSQPPAIITERTNLTDIRTAGFLHLKLATSLDAHDIYLPDLPGEWSDSLVADVSSADRLSFLERADGILLFVDGTRLESAERHLELHDTNLLLSRIKFDLNIKPATPVGIVVAKSDLIGMRVPECLGKIERSLDDLQLDCKIFQLASFSHDCAIYSHGTGVENILNWLLIPRQSRLIPSTGLEDLSNLRNVHRVRFPEA